MGKSQDTPMMRQFNEIKRSHQDKILFFRMGDFYEMFGEDALIAARILKIQITSRDKNKENAIPMCGVPVHSMQGYLQKLVVAGHKVAICDQVEDAGQAKGIVKREVVQVVTPGTIIASELLEPNANIYLASLTYHKKSRAFGLTFCDFSTGLFESDAFPQEQAFDKIFSFFSLYQPGEILLPETAKENGQEIYEQLLYRASQEESLSLKNEYLPPESFEYDRCLRILKNHFGDHSLAGYGISNLPAAICSAGALLEYLQYTQQTNPDHITQIRILPGKEHMTLDDSTVKNLELFEPLSNGEKEQTLYHLLNKTSSPMGARLLRKWISAPILNREKVTQRLDATEEMLQKHSIRDSLRETLKFIGDLERCISRISLPGTTVLDMIRLRDSLRILPEIEKITKEINTVFLNEQKNRFDLLRDISELLETAFCEEPSLKLKEGGYIAEGYLEKLDHWRNLTKNGKQLVAELESKEKIATGINGLKVKFNRVFGYYIEISNTAKQLVPPRYTRKQTLTNAERFITEELKDLEESILSAEDESSLLEQAIFQEIREKIHPAISRIHRTASALAHVDVIISFASLAESYRYNRPHFIDSGTPQIKIHGSRHPVIESLSEDRSFISNDVDLNSSLYSIMLITGPNMGGKSTYMRQMALIVLMAQIGCFVPADSAHLTIFDRIFTRVGASDNLARGQSTFMVEMNEAASILNHATKDSLIIFDEIGRGTGTFDGIGIAWAIVEYLHEIGSLTLFATHYHELTLLAEKQKRVVNFHVSVQEEREEIIFLRKVLPGKSDKSYGVQVAKLAGLPKIIIERAEEIRYKLEHAENSLRTEEPAPVFMKRKKKTILQEKAEQLDFLSLIEDPLSKQLKELNLNTITPMEALNILQKWKNKPE